MAPNSQFLPPAKYGTQHTYNYVGIDQIHLLNAVIVIITIIIDYLISCDHLMFITSYTVTITTNVTYR